MEYTEKIVDITTGEETIRPYTSKEIAAAKAAQVEIDAEQETKKAEQAVKDAAKQAVLDKLGLSADEVAALLG